MFTVGFAFSKKGRKKKTTSSLAKCYLGLTFIFMIEVAVSNISINVVLSKFFSTGTSQVGKLLLKTIGTLAVLNLGIELGWRSVVLTIERTACDLQNVCVGMRCYYVVIISIASRSMYSAATNTQESLLYEVVGIVAGLITADSLLQGRTPMEDTITSIRGLLSFLKKIGAIKETAKVKPESIIPPTPEWEEVVKSKSRFYR